MILTNAFFLFEPFPIPLIELVFSLIDQNVDQKSFESDFFSEARKTDLELFIGPLTSWRTALSVPAAGVDQSDQDLAGPWS